MSRALSRAAMAAVHAGTLKGAGGEIDQVKGLAERPRAGLPLGRNAQRGVQTIAEFAQAAYDSAMPWTSEALVLQLRLFLHDSRETCWKAGVVTAVTG